MVRSLVAGMVASVMSGAAAEHIREGIPVLTSYCDALGVRA